MLLIIREYIFNNKFNSLNFNRNNLVEILFISVILFNRNFNYYLLVDFMMCLIISFIVLKIPTSSLSEKIYNQVLVLLLFVFLTGSQYFCCCVHFHQFLLQACSHKNICQFYKFKHYIVFEYFLIQINASFLLVLILLSLKWHHIVWILILF